MFLRTVGSACFFVGALVLAASSSSERFSPTANALVEASKRATQAASRPAVLAETRASMTQRMAAMSVGQEAWFQAPEDSRASAGVK